jgi:hypothetical protein
MTKPKQKAAAPKREADKPKKIGRPKGSSPYAETKDSIKVAIVEWIGNGKTLREFCRQPGSPNWTAIYDWMEADEIFAPRAHMARAGASRLARLNELGLLHPEGRPWTQGEAHDAILNALYPE